MAEYILFFDDLTPEDDGYLTGNICNAISKITNSKIKTIVVNGGGECDTALALPLIKRTINIKIDMNKDILIGICIDLVDEIVGPELDENGQLIHGGERLLEEVLEDPDLKHFKVLIYTSRYPELRQRLLSKGACKYIMRKDIHTSGSNTVYDCLAGEVLDAFDCQGYIK